MGVFCKTCGTGDAACEGCGTTLSMDEEELSEVEKHVLGGFRVFFTAKPLDLATACTNLLSTRLRAFLDHHLLEGVNELDRAAADFAHAATSAYTGHELELALAMAAAIRNYAVAIKPHPGVDEPADIGDLGL